MRLVVQRVENAQLSILNHEVVSIDRGLVVLVGIEHNDTLEDAQWLAIKVCKLRIFNDLNNVMNLSLIDIQGDLLLVSNFTLHARTKKGSRPSYIDAAGPAIAIPLYESFILMLETELNKKIKTGVFGEDMNILMNNSGPVTIFIDSKNKE